MKKLTFLLILLAGILVHGLASASILTFNLESSGGITLNPYLSPTPNNYSFNFLSGVFSFDTETGVGEYTAELVFTQYANGWNGTTPITWTPVTPSSFTLSGQFSQVSFINNSGNFNPTTYSEYFQFLQTNGVSGSNYTNSDAIIFNSIDLALTYNGIGTSPYSGEMNFTGAMNPTAYITLPDPNGNFQMNYLLYSDPNNDGCEPGDPNCIPDGSYYGSDCVWMKGPEESNAIPEPATMALMGMGLAGFGLRKRMKK